MILKHRIYFFFWRIFLWLNRIDYGTIVYFDTGTEKIKGTVHSFHGDSISKKNFGFAIRVDFEKPLEGNNPNLFNVGFFPYKDFVKEFR